MPHCSWLSLRGVRRHCSSYRLGGLVFKLPTKVALLGTTGVAAVQHIRLKGLTSTNLAVLDPVCEPAKVQTLPALLKITGTQST